MNKIFVECDRCFANLTSIPKTIREVSVFFPTLETGVETKKEVILCADCYNNLLNFFGKKNIFTGMDFLRA